MTDPQKTEAPKAAAARGKTGQAMETAREAAQTAARRTVESIEGNPLSVLVGGLAVGVLAGALLPRTERETEMLGPVGRQLRQSAATAARAARDAGTAELAAAGISRDAARAQVNKLLDNVMTAVKTAGDAAAKAAKPEN